MANRTRRDQLTALLRPFTRATRARLRELVEVYPQLEQYPQHRLALAELGEAMDRAQQAREQLKRDGLTVRGERDAIRAHPALAVEKSAREHIARLLNLLNLRTAEER